MLNTLQRESMASSHRLCREHLADLNERLEAVLKAGDERGCYLEFEASRWEAQSYFVQVEHLMAASSRKQGDLERVEQLYHDYQVG